MKTEIIEFKDTEIYCPVENGQIYVAIKPICEALGIDHSSQVKRIKRDEKTSQLWSSMTTVGADNKSRQMVCLPLKFIFGWIFTVDSGLVKKGSKEQLIAYQLECYDVLYEHFWNNAKAIKKKETMLTESEKRIAEMEGSKKDLARKIKAEKERFKQIALAPANQLDLFIEE